MEKSLYIHIPFCCKKCKYCDFYSVTASRPLIKDYIAVLNRQLSSLEPEFATIYIGGGTPSILELETLGSLLDFLDRVSEKAEEFSIEVNPESVDRKKLKLLLKKGVNRISIGVQSFNDKKLKRLGRLHSSKKAEESVKLAQDCGFDNISLDLIFGTEQESLKDWEGELIKATGFKPAHISAYALSYEKGTPLYQELENGEDIPVDDEIVALMYKKTMSFLPKAGFKHYEVSNFSKPGFQCRQNMNYWYSRPYVGLGPSAVSFDGILRRKNIPEITPYMSRVKAGKSLIVAEEKLSGKSKAKLAAAIKIRTKEGIDFKWFRDRWGYDFPRLEAGVLEPLIEEGLIGYRYLKGKRRGICLTKRGFLFADSVSSEFL